MLNKMNHRRWFLRKIGSQNMNLGLRISLSLSLSLPQWTCVWFETFFGILEMMMILELDDRQSKLTLPRPKASVIVGESRIWVWWSCVMVSIGNVRLEVAQGFENFVLFGFARSWRTRFGGNFGLFDSFLTLPIHGASNDARYNNLTLKVHQRGHSVSVSVSGVRVNRANRLRLRSHHVNAPTTHPTSISLPVSTLQFVWVSILLLISWTFQLISRLYSLLYTNFVTFHMSKITFQWF